MRAVQDIDVDVLEVAVFFECRQVIDTVTGIRHPVNITINKAEEVTFPKKIFQYTQIMVLLIEEKRFLPV